MNRRISRPEFVTLMAALMAVEALAIDIMLPAFPAIGQALGVSNPNHRSFMLTAFLLGFGPLQVAVGPLTDRFGRRGTILVGLAAYVAASFACALSGSFTALLAARFVQGAAAACVKVAMTASVRDRYAGQAMVDIMSLVAAIFLIVPVVCPAIGQALLVLGSWRLIFGFIGTVGFVLGAWCALRLEESLPLERRRAREPRAVTQAFRTVLSERRAFFYGTAGAFMYGIISNMLNTAQQIYVDLFGLGAWFPVAFAFTTVVASISSLFMSRITRTLGMRRTAHAAVVLISVISAVFVLASLRTPPRLWSFYLMLLLVFPAVVATFATTGALSLHPFGELAGTAASVFGAVTFVGGALFGAVTAQLYNGTVTPVLAANCVMGLGAAACFLAAEKGRLFGADDDPPGEMDPHEERLRRSRSEARPSVAAVTPPRTC